ncbi:hypothetical protein EVAR_28457_1 [Eumeta japonica]|uniref:Uncharacterized protein n=1 Tax=Eumeta variegata TaxID=151549 RepID=A0A4C1V9B4_EUMVA|nr:hypothetical protein EVAR_28457_1 [Eumeta japonica]
MNFTFRSIETLVKTASELLQFHGSRTYLAFQLALVLKTKHNNSHRAEATRAESPGVRLRSLDLKSSVLTRYGLGQGSYSPMQWRCLVVGMIFETQKNMGRADCQPRLAVYHNKSSYKQLNSLALEWDDSAVECVDFELGAVGFDPDHRQIRQTSFN